MDRAKTQSSPRRKFAIRLGLLLLSPLVFLAVAEFVCTVAGVRVPRYYGSGPGIVDYWVPAEDPAVPQGFVRAFPRSHRIYPEKAPLFLRVKPKGGFRVFVLGESSVQGLPFEIGSFSDWLRLELTAMLPGRTVEVVNGGNAGWFATEIRTLLQESLQYQPDAIVWMVGHNEMVPQNVRQLRRELTSPVFDKFRKFVMGLRLTHVLSKIVPNWSLTTRATLHDQRPSDYQPCYRPEELTPMKARFAEATRGAVRDCKAAGVPVILCTMPKNLRDSPPTGSVISADLRVNPARLSRFEFLVASALESLSHGDATAALRALDEAAALDTLPAKLHFAKAQAFEKLGEIDKAKESYVKALALDACPMRAPEWVEDTIRGVAAEEVVPLADLETLFSSVGVNGISGSEWISDNVHPNLLGHEKIAEVLLTMFERRLSLPLDRTRQVSSEDGRKQIGIDKYEEVESIKSECIANVQLALEMDAVDDQWRRAHELCLQVLAVNPKDHEVSASLGILEALAGNADKARGLLEAAMAADTYVRLSMVYYNIANAPHRRAFERAKVDIAAVQNNLTAAERQVLDNRLQRAGLK